jgi:hypothetical protein
MTSAWSTGAPSDDRCMPRPSRPRSQPMPTAPGPNSFQWSLTRLMWSSSNRVPPSPSGVRRTSIQLIMPPNSHVAAKLFGGSQRSTVPPALPSSW